MPGTVAEGPSVSLSFANNFWGKEDAGVSPLLERMHSAKLTSDELKSFYGTRAAIEEEYARKLLQLSRKALGSQETGTLRASLDVMRGEVESMGKAHQNIAQQMKGELEEPLAAFSGGLKERRKIVQNGIEKLLKIKTQQTQSVNKSRDRFEQDCLRIKGYLAQGHMVMGQEERKNKAKLEKTQIQMASTSNEYEAAVKCLEETTGRWNRDWKLACDKFQDLEEERIDFTKSSLWTFANVASTVCVSDDASCEKIRLSLENCEVEKDITSFITNQGTGQEIPDPPKYINFCRGDINDSASEASEDECYSVAQFQRTINPAFRTSSPVPSTFESHHDPNSDLAKHMSGQDDQATPKGIQQPLKSNGQAPTQPDFRRQAAEVQAAFQNAPAVDLAPVPHNEFPTDGMTMFCRSDGQSDLSTSSPLRPGSRDTQSDYSNPTSMSSIEPASGNVSPLKQYGGQASQPASPNKPIQKKRSGFFSNSPFRRRSKHEKERPQSFVAPKHTPSNNLSPTRPGIQARDFASQPSDLEPVDPRANFQLNVGSNVFDVASPDSQHQRNSPSKPSTLSKRSGGPPPGNAEDPLVAALAELKGVAKQSSTRISADRYHGIATPAPPAPGSHMTNNPGARGTPPPGYHDPSQVKRLDAPQPAHTSASMQATTRKYVGQGAEMYGSSSRPGTSSGRAASPNPATMNRAASPRPGIGNDAYRAASPNPFGRPAPRGQSANSSPQKGGGYAGGGGNGGGYTSRHGSPGDIPRARSPVPGYTPNGNGRPASAMAGNGNGNGGMVLSHGQSGDGGALGQGGRRGGGPAAGQGRPMSYYAGQPGGNNGGGGGGGGGDNRTRSRSVAAPRGGERQAGGGGGGGEGMLHYARALYSYTAAIPEELSFQKHDVLAIIRLQDDGWWEAEIQGGARGGTGLVPSNYLQRC
ncbi:hypothetical protein MMC10_006384 [Thelotrema lepadinum]|nr:hypothetical protein [Thelotrema lepadinum]